MNYAIEIAKLHHSFGEKEILKDISLGIHEGEIFGLLGTSGAGKTTLINILTGQLKYSGGSAKILEEECSRLSREAHRQISVMTDSLGLCERLSIYDNMAFFADLQGIPRERIDDVLHAVGLYQDRKKSIINLSKGMKNRTSLARAFLGDNKILFLDEPTSGLDPATASEIHELIREYNKNGCTIFMTTHNMAEAEELCSHVALLHKGKIIRYGTPRQISIENDRQKKLYITLKSGEDITLPNSPEAADLLSGWLQRDFVDSIHSSEPGLKEVFLELTGGSSV